MKNVSRLILPDFLYLSTDTCQNKKQKIKKRHVWFFNYNASLKKSPLVNIFYIKSVQFAKLNSLGSTFSEVLFHNCKFKCNDRKMSFSFISTNTRWFLTNTLMTIEQKLEAATLKYSASSLKFDKVWDLCLDNKNRFWRKFWIIVKCCPDSNLNRFA